MPETRKIAVIGASGFIGSAIMEQLEKNHNVVGTSSKGAKGYFSCDITKKADVKKFLDTHKPEVVIHLAALTDVDLCEREKKLAYNVHVRGTQNLVDACKNLEPKFIYFSTDFVFDGKKGDYSEKDSTNPINNYGLTKLQGEKIAAALSNCVILRTSTPYSINSGSKKFLSTLLGKLSKGEKANAFSDFKRSPTLIENLAENIPGIISANYKGTLNLTGTSGISMYDAALEVAQVFDFDPSLIKKTTSASIVLDAPRPLDTTLNVSLAKKLGLNLISFKEGLLRVKKQ